MKIRWVEATHRVPHLTQCTACELQAERGDLARELREILTTTWQSAHLTRQKIAELADEMEAKSK